MKFGMNLLLWTDDPTQERLLPLYERLAGMGYDGVELPIFDPQPRVEAYATLGRRLDDMGLARTAVAIRTPNDDPLSPDPAVRRAAVECTQRAIDCCEASGCALLCGPLYAVVGQFSGAGPTDEEWGRSVAVLRDAADYAARSDVTLALEYLNRFEIYLLNTAADTARFARDVARANLGVHYDTFHANIEEKDVSVAIEGCASQLRHVHISENDRGTPGAGQVRWSETFEALARCGYDGWLTVEAFGQLLPSLAAATKIWRPLFDDPEQLAEDALGFMKRQWAAVS
jgi:D-psicose/D-tagatose/L-ribulose 3-epimerase